MTLRIGILGAARIARGFVAGVAGSEKVVVAAIASRRRESAEAFAAEFGLAKVHDTYDALLADSEIDAIYNPLPNALHASWSIRATEAGKHVLCEKPLALSADEARAMFAAAERCGVRLVEAYPYLAQPQTLKLRALLVDGAIGRVRFVQASFGFTLTREVDIRLDPALGGGALMDAGCYPVSLVRVLAGERPRRIHAVADWTESGVDRSLVATLEHASGLMAQIACSFSTSDNRNALIAGDAGIIQTNYWNHTTPERPAIVQLKQGTKPSDIYQAIEAPLANGFRAEADAFADHVAGGPWNGANVEESIDIALTLDAILASARRRAPVDLS